MTGEKLKELAMRHRFGYDEAALKVGCRCGWMHPYPIGMTNAWEQWVIHFSGKAIVRELANPGIDPHARRLFFALEEIRQVASGQVHVAEGMAWIEWMLEIRQAVADYMRSEGCSCCRNMEAHEKHEARLAKLLRVPKYKDGSGYDFSKFRSKP